MIIMMIVIMILLLLLIKMMIMITTSLLITFSEWNPQKEEIKRRHSTEDKPHRDWWLTASDGGQPATPRPSFSPSRLRELGGFRSRQKGTRREHEFRRFPSRGQTRHIRLRLCRICPWQTSLNLTDGSPQRRYHFGRQVQRNWTSCENVHFRTIRMCPRMRYVWKKMETSSSTGSVYPFHWRHVLPQITTPFATVLCPTRSDKLLLWR